MPEPARRHGAQRDQPAAHRRAAAAELAGINLGAANQVAKANIDGSSYGASGAVSNSGGVSVGGNNNAFPANATIDLNAGGLAGTRRLRPGAGSARRARRCQGDLGAVAAIAQTPVGYGKAGSTTYKIADVKLQLGSPLLGGLLGTVLHHAQHRARSSLTALAGASASPPAATSRPGSAPTLTSRAAPSPSTPPTGGLTISLDKLLKQLGLDLNALPANTDLINLLLNYLTSPNGLAKALQGPINGLTDPLSAKFTDCPTAPATPARSAGAGLLTPRSPTSQRRQDPGRDGHQRASSTARFGGRGQPARSAGAVLKKLIDIGVNVQPLVKAGDLHRQAGRPKQGTPVKQNQTPPPAVPYCDRWSARSRLNVLARQPAALGSALLEPGPGHTPRPARHRHPTLALANAAAGPSTPGGRRPAPSSHLGADTNVPTGVPAGAGTHGGSPVLPLALLLLGLMLAGGGAFAYRYRGTLNQH